MNQDPVSRTRNLHGAIGGATVRLHHKKRCSHVFIDSQTHVPSQGTEFVMNFAFEIRRHVMGTFGTNRIYTVGLVVKVVVRMRLGACSRAGSIPSVSRMQNSSE